MGRVALPPKVENDIHQAFHIDSAHWDSLLYALSPSASDGKFLCISWCKADKNPQ
jgi:hypothetical protein